MSVQPLPARGGPALDLRPGKLFRRLLVANRGEVAARVIRACHTLGIEAVAVYSTADADSPHLELAEEKTRCLEFGRFARRNARERGNKPEEFTFLGLTHYCGTTRKGYFKVKRRTSRKKFQATTNP